MKPSTLFLFLCLALFTTAAWAALKPGDAAPDFTVDAALGGEEFKFSLAEALKKGPVVLYFYPKSFTSVCTVEAHEFAENIAPTLAEPPPLIGALKPSSAELAIMNVIGPLKAGWFLKVTGLAKMLSEKSLEFIPYTPLFNVTGQPAMSVPVHWNGAGLPVGMQFVARFGDEATLFRLAAQLEQAQPWFERVPAGY